MQLSLDAPAALAEHLRQEQAKQKTKGTPKEGKATDREDGDRENGEDKDVAYQERDDKMYTREDYGMIEVETAVAAPDVEAFVAGMRNLTAPLDRAVLDTTWVKSGIHGTMELYRGLKAMSVPVELFVFPGMGHPITKPRETHAVMHQNLTWFSHYLLGEDLELD